MIFDDFGSIEEDVAVGEELYVSYGGPDWFESRYIPLDENGYSAEPYTELELQQVGHCLTDIFVKESLLPMAGQGVFAKKSYLKGDIVYVTAIRSNFI